MLLPYLLLQTTESSEPTDWRWVAAGVVAFYVIAFLGWLIFRKR